MCQIPDKHPMQLFNVCNYCTQSKCKGNKFHDTIQLMFIFYSIVDFENQNSCTPRVKKKLQNSCVIKRIELILRYNNKARELYGFA